MTAKPVDPLARGALGAAKLHRVALCGVAVSVILATMMTVLAVTSGSLVLTATAVDTTIDTVGAVLLWLGLRLSTRKSTRFPYGLYKIENVAQIVIAILIFIGAYEIGRQALEGGERTPDVTVWTLAGLVATIALTIAYSVWVAAKGRRYASPALKAEGRHRLADSLSAALALVASVSTYVGYDIDRYVTIPVVALVVFAGWGLLRDGMKVLLDASVEPATRATIETILAGDPLVSGVRSLTARNAGRYVFLEATLLVRTDDLAKAHAASQRLVEAVRRAVPRLDDVTLHLEPQRHAMITAAMPLETTGGELSTEFGSAPVFRFVQIRTRDGAPIAGETIDNPYTGVERQKGLLVAEWLVQRQVDTLLVRQAPNKGPTYVLHDGGVRIRQVETGDVEEELARLGRELALDTSLLQ